jgi:hypothetical protein
VYLTVRATPTPTPTPTHPPLGYAVKINFQPAGAANPLGFVKDSGGTFGMKPGLPPSTELLEFGW